MKNYKIKKISGSSIILYLIVMLLTGCSSSTVQPTTATRKKIDNIIIGAGPAGLLAACRLKQAGKEVAIFEVRERPKQFWGSFPVVVNKRGQFALSSLGDRVLQKLYQRGRSVEEMHIVNGRKTMAEIPTFGTCIMRDQMVGILLGVADRLHVPMYWNHKLVDIDFSTKSCTFVQQAPSSGSSVSSSSKQKRKSCIVQVGNCCIGADGNYSRVRRECEQKVGLKVKSQNWGIKMRYLLIPPSSRSSLLPRGLMKRRKTHDNPSSSSSSSSSPATSSSNNNKKISGAVHYVHGGDGYIGQQPDGTWSFSLSVTNKDLENGNKAFMTSTDATPDNISMLRDKCESTAPAFTERILTNSKKYKSFFQCRLFDGEIVKCSTLAPTNWIGLIGDAGHAVAPYTGEGINSGLESANICADVIIGNGCMIDYDNRRRRDAHALNGFAMRQKRIVCGTQAEKFVNTFGTVVLGISKKMGMTKYIFQDYTLGARAQYEDPWRYKDLLALDNRQRLLLNPIGASIYYGMVGPIVFGNRLKNKAISIKNNKT